MVAVPPLQYLDVHANRFRGMLGQVRLQDYTMNWLEDDRDGYHPYVVTHRAAFGREYSFIFYAPDLATAKQERGWTREHLASRRVRRARSTDAGLHVERGT